MFKMKVHKDVHIFNSVVYRVKEHLSTVSFILVWNDRYSVYEVYRFNTPLEETGHRYTYEQVFDFFKSGKWISEYTDKALEKKINPNEQERKKTDQ